MSDYSIGVDLGGTNLRAAAIDRGGNILARASSSTDEPDSRDAIIGDMVAAIQAVRSEVTGGTLIGVGIGIPGYIRMETGVVIGSANLPGLDNFPFRDEVRKRVDA